MLSIMKVHNGVPHQQAVISRKTYMTLELVSLPPGDRDTFLAPLLIEFPRKVVMRKLAELVERGYVSVPPPAEASALLASAPESDPIPGAALTNRGQAVLDLCRFQAGLR